MNSLQTTNHAQNIEGDGYTVVPSVLTREEVSTARAFFTKLFGRKPEFPGDQQYPARPGARGGGVRHDAFSRYPETRRVLESEDVLEMLRSVLRRRLRPAPRDGSARQSLRGWHKDTTPLESAGHDFHWEPEFRILECGIYFQDNDEFGGGLDIVPGSQREPDDSPPPPKVTFLRRVRGKLSQMGLLAIPKDPEAPPEPRRLSIPNGAGDLVAFDLRAKHMATQPQPGIEKVPEDKRKFALFFTAGANNDHTRRYRDFIAAQYGHLQDDAPHEYPGDLIELATRQRLTLI